jgi:hypothetical protein
VDKLTEQVSIRLPWAEYRQLSGLAALGDASISEYVRGVVTDHLLQRRAQYERMQGIFDTPGNTENPAPKDQP